MYFQVCNETHIYLDNFNISYTCRHFLISFSVIFQFIPTLLLKHVIHVPCLYHLGIQLVLYVILLLVKLYRKDTKLCKLLVLSNKHK